MRDITPDVNVGIDDLTFRLDMDALCDFEDEVGITVAEFLAPFADVLGDIGFEGMQDISDEEQNAAGVDMLKKVLNSGALSAKQLRAFVWALAGGKDIDKTPREIGHMITWQNKEQIFEKVMKAIQEGHPEADEDAADAAPEADADDPTPESNNTGQ